MSKEDSLSSATSKTATAAQSLEPPSSTTPASDDDIVGCNLTSSSEVEVTSDGNSSDLELNGFDIDNHLEERLKKHGLNRRNVKTIIHELLSDEHVRGLLRANLDEEKNHTCLPETKNLRSKISTNEPSTSAKTDAIAAKFTDIPLPEDDDEDEEYHPEFEEIFMENEASQESTNDFDSSIDCTDQGLMLKTPLKGDGTALCLEPLNFYENTQQEADAQSILQQEIIAQRTRSKHSLLDIAMAEIETAFQPPDVTEDMYVPSGDDDWHKWLAELMLDETVLNVPDVCDDDHEQDPDYNFIQSEAEDMNEKEDYRNDHGTHIPKKEVQELLKEHDVETLDFKGQSVSTSASFSRDISFSTSFSCEKSVSLTSNISASTVKDQLSYLRKQKRLSSPKKRSKHENISTLTQECHKNFEPLAFSKLQLDMLTIQLKQHVQLLTQTNILSRNFSSCTTNVHGSHTILKELEQLGIHNRGSFNIKTSYFDVPGLSDALRIAQSHIPPSDPVTKLTKHERSRALRAVPRSVAEIMATNALFAFGDLLPNFAPQDLSKDHSRLTFNSFEDNLLVLGLAQMEGHTVPCNVLIHQYMMPCKQPEQLRSRITNANQGRYGATNPIRLYKRNGKLPIAPALFRADVGFGTNFENLLAVKRPELPDWLITLQHEKELHAKSFKMDDSSLKENSSQDDFFTCSTTSLSLETSLNQQPTNVVAYTSANIQTVTVPILHQPSVMNIQEPISIVLPAIIASPQKVSFGSLSYSDGIAKRPMSLSSAKKTENLLESIKQTFSSSDSKKKRVKKLGKPNKKKKESVLENKIAVSGAVPDSSEVSSPTNVITKPCDNSIEIVENQAAEFNNKFANSYRTCDKNKTLARTGNKKSHVLKQSVKPIKILLSQGTQIDEKQGETSLCTDTEIPEGINPAITTENNNNMDVDETFLEDDALMTEDDMDDIDHDEPVIGVEEFSEDEASSGRKAWQGGRKRQACKDATKLKVKWKKRKESNSKKLGGRLHRLHPALSGKKKSRSSDDSLSKSLRQSAEKVKLLEEDTIVQLDPARVEKESIFAKGYLQRIEEVLVDQPDVLNNVLTLFCEFDLDCALSPPELFTKLLKLLSPWPDLVQGFAPFVLPTQAEVCGLLSEQQVYARTRKFLRQLEIRFHDNQQHLNRILNAFHVMAKSAIYNEPEMKSTIMSLLKSDSYLQEEFLMFFDNERPPESRLHGDYEEIIWNDDLLKDSSMNKFEQISIPSIEGQEASMNTQEGQSGSAYKPSSCNITRTTDDKNAVSVAEAVVEEQVISTTWDKTHSSDIEESVTEDKSEPNQPFTADIGVISEDALSCSPFKRHVPPSTSLSSPFPPPESRNDKTPLNQCGQFDRSTADVEAVDLERPLTPTALPTSMDESLSLPSLIPVEHSSSEASIFPATPTGSLTSMEVDSSQPGVGFAQTRWTREEDTLLLSSCKLHGPTIDTFQQVAEECEHTPQEANDRFTLIMAMLSGADPTDTDTTSHYSDSDTNDDSTEE